MKKAETFAKPWGKFCVPILPTHFLSLPWALPSCSTYPLKKLPLENRSETAAPSLCKTEACLILRHWLGTLGFCFFAATGFMQRRICAQTLHPQLRDGDKAAAFACHMPAEHHCLGVRRIWSLCQPWRRHAGAPLIAHLSETNSICWETHGSTPSFPCLFGAVVPTGCTPVPQGGGSSQRRAAAYPHRSTPPVIVYSSTCREKSAIFKQKSHISMQRWDLPL